MEHYRIRVMCVVILSVCFLHSATLGTILPAAYKLDLIIQYVFA